MSPFSIAYLVGMMVLIVLVVLYIGHRHSKTASSVPPVTPPKPDIPSDGMMHAGPTTTTVLSDVTVKPYLPTPLPIKEMIKTVQEDAGCEIKPKPRPKRKPRKNYEKRILDQKSDKKE